MNTLWADGGGTVLRRSKNLRGLAETRWPRRPVARRQLGPQAGAPESGVWAHSAHWPRVWSTEKGTLGALPQAGAETEIQMQDIYWERNPGRTMRG